MCWKNIPDAVWFADKQYLGLTEGHFFMNIRFAVVAVLCLPLGAQAQGLNLASQSSSARADVLHNQMRLMDGRLSEQYSRSERLLPPSTRDTGAAVIPPYTGAYAGPFLQLARAAARRHNLPEDLFLRLIHQESRWNPGAVSSKGALGLAQLMPDTARLLRVDPHDPEQNLEGGARYLRMMYDRFGNWELALAAYNAGPGAVDTHGGIPPFRETRQYVQIIMGAG